MILTSLAVLVAANSKQRRRKTIKGSLVRLCCEKASADKKRCRRSVRETGIYFEGWSKSSQQGKPEDDRPTHLGFT